MHLDRRQFAMAGGAALVCSSALIGGSRAVAAGSSDPMVVVDRWLNEVVRKGATDRMEEFVRPDAVMVLHGVGANKDGTPRRIEGLTALRDFIAKVRSRWVSPPEFRIDDRLVDGGKIALRGRNVWHRQTAAGPEKTAQSMAIFYYVEAGRLYQIERYVDQIRNAAG